MLPEICIVFNLETNLFYLFPRKKIARIVDCSQKEAPNDFSGKLHSDFCFSHGKNSSNGKNESFM